MISHAFDAFHAFWILFKSNIMENTMLPMLSMLSFFVNSHASHAFHGFPWFFIPCFPCFHGELSYNFCCPMLAWKAWEFPHENHGILLWLHAPWFSRESMEFSPCFFHGFSMVFPCFQYQGNTEQAPIEYILMVEHPNERTI